MKSQKMIKESVIAEFVKLTSAAHAQQISYYELAKKTEIKIRNKDVRHCEGAVRSSEKFSTSVCKMLDMNMQTCGTTCFLKMS